MYLSFLKLCYNHVRIVSIQPIFFEVDTLLIDEAVKQQLQLILQLTTDKTIITEKVWKSEYNLKYYMRW